LEKNKLAEYHFRKAKEIIESQKDGYSYVTEKSKYYYNIIDFHILYGEYAKALKECDQAYLFFEVLDSKSTKGKTIYQSDILYRSASIHYRQGNINQALMITDRGIDNLTSFLDNISIGNTHTASRNKYTSALPELFILKSQILLQKFNESSSIENLTAAFDSYQNAIETLNYIKLAMRDENSKLFATSQILEVYYEAIYVSKLLFDLTGDLQYHEKSFEIAESSKSFALYSEIKEMEAMEFGDLPKQVKERENRLLGEIQAYEEYLYEHQIAANPDSSQIEFFKDKLFHLKDDYIDLKQEIEQNNSKYYELKYNPEFITLEEVRKQIPYRDAMIEYVLSDTLLITYVIDRKGIHSFSQEIGPEFADECFEYYKLLYSQNFSDGVHENYKRYVNLGRKFYSILIEPCLEYTDKKNLTIVPDGAITYIPFEGLITEDTETEYINYMTLPYMIKDYSVGYSHSSTLMFSKRLKTKSPESEVLAFAPVYKDIDYPQGDLSSMREAIDASDFLLPLYGIIKEVQSIKETVPSRVFINEKATEANFKKYASDYNILHLAMHTMMRDDDPLYSMLAFTNVDNADATEDNRLYAYEIYNLKLNAQMAVLSSCNSGFGKMMKGEGMMSLARGFMYAGCPSIIMTLWQVADKSSSELMTSFYKYLKRGKSKQEAMRLAKLDYLENADDLTSNPYFWSAFVVLGDSTPIYRKSGVAYWMIIVTLFLGMVLFIQYRRS
jgi:CHAT domain-containing protein